MHDEYQVTATDGECLYRGSYLPLAVLTAKAHPGEAVLHGSRPDNQWVAIVCFRRGDVVSYLMDAQEPAKWAKPTANSRRIMA